MNNIECKFFAAKKTFYTVLNNFREIDRIASCYTSAFENPYGDDLRDMQNKLERAIAAFGPLMADAIRAGHHGKWIARRMPEEFVLIKNFGYNYCAKINTSIGVCCGITVADSGISDRDLFVRWKN